MLPSPIFIHKIVYLFILARVWRWLGFQTALLEIIPIWSIVSNLSCLVYLMTFFSSSVNAFHCLFSCNFRWIFTQEKEAAQYTSSYLQFNIHGYKRCTNLWNARHFRFWFFTLKCTYTLLFAGSNWEHSGFLLELRRYIHHYQRKIFGSRTHDQRK